MKRFTFLFFLLLSFTLVAQLPSKIDPETAGFSEDRLARLSNFLNKEIEAGKIPGGVCMIIRNGALAHKATYGYNNWTDKEAMQEDKIFYIQSMTKPIISVAFMMLYEEGHFELHDPLHQYLPQFKDRKIASFDKEGEMTLTNANEVITLEHVLTHTAGFLHGLGGSALDVKYRVALYGADFSQNPHQTIEDRVHAMSELPLVGEPGERWMYSASPDILALLIEQFSGQTVAEFLQERIFDPLDMKDSGYNITEKNTPRAVGLHAMNATGELFYSPQQTPTSGNTVFGGTHGLFSTAADYMKFGMMLLHQGTFNGKRLLSRKTLEWMTLNHVGDLRGNGEGFGLGFGVLTDLAANSTMGSEGQFFWNGAFNTYFFVDPKENLIAVLMMQMWPYNDYYSRTFKQLVYQAIDD